MVDAAVARPSAVPQRARVGPRAEVVQVNVFTILPGAVLHRQEALHPTCQEQKGDSPSRPRRNYTRARHVLVPAEQSGTRIHVIFCSIMPARSSKPAGSHGSIKGSRVQPELSGTSSTAGVDADERATGVWKASLLKHSMDDAWESSEPSLGVPPTTALGRRAPVSTPWEHAMGARHGSTPSQGVIT